MGDHDPAGDGPELRYMMVARVITERIESGEYPRGGRLPPEHEIARELGVAYLTVRKAMGILRERGLVATIWGLGTFVRDGGRR